MINSDFRLRPWEYGGFAPAPSRVIEARVEGALRQFDVKWREGRAFFRLADSGDNRVWASWNNIGASQFAGAVESANIGRYFVVERGFSTQAVDAKFGAEVKSRRGTYDLFGSTALAVIITDDNRGRAQEWCGGPWLEFTLPPRPPINSGARKPSIWHPGWNVSGLPFALANLAGELAFRPFEPNLANDDQELAFVNGSLEQLRRLYQAAYLIFARAALEKQPWLRHYMSAAHSIRAETAQSRAWPHNDNDYVIPASLLAAFIRHNLPVGGQWQRVRVPEIAPVPKWNRFLARHSPPQPEIPQRRLDFRFNPHNVRLDFEVFLTPSAHEQLEARLLLRDWMQENLSPAQYAKLRGFIET